MKNHVRRAKLSRPRKRTVSPGLVSVLVVAVVDELNIWLGG